MINNLDLFKLLISFRYKEKESFSTPCGIIVSIFITIAILFSIMFFSQDVYLKQNPNVITNEEYIIGIPELEIDNNFLLGI